MTVRQGRMGHAGLWLALGSLLVLVAVAAVGNAQARTAVRDDAVDRVRSNADGAARSVTAQAADFRRTVEAAATSPALVNGLRGRSPDELRAVEEVLAFLARGKSSPAAFVTDDRGVNLAVFPRQPELLGKDFSFRDWYKGVSSTHAPYVSEAYRSVAQGQPLVVGVSAPIWRGSVVIGYLTALWQLESVREVAEGARRDDGVAVTVTDQRGQDLTSVPKVDARGEPEPHAVPDDVARALKGERVSFADDERLGSTVPVPSLGWTVTASVRRSEAMASANASSWRLGGLLGVALLVVALLSALLHRDSRRRARQHQEVVADRARLAALFDASPVGIIEGLPDGTILAVNRSFADLVGYRVDELLSMKAAALAHPDSAEAIAGALDAVLDGRTSHYTQERLYRAKDGTPVPALVSVVVLRDEDGTLRRMVAFAVDLRQQRLDHAELRRALEELQSRERFVEALVDTMGASVLACDADGQLTLVNREARRVHALMEDEEVRDISSLRVTDTAGAALAPERRPLMRALREGHVQGIELVVHPRDGSSPVTLLVNARQLHGPDGEVQGAVVVGHDITSLRRAEEALQVSEERFRRVFDEGFTGDAMADDRGVVLRVNNTLCELVGCDPAKAPGKPLEELFADPLVRADVRAALVDSAGRWRGSWQGEAQLNRPDGRVVWGRVFIMLLEEPGAQGVLLVQVDDVTARRAAELRLIELALHDELTGLPNRRLLLERCEQALAVARSGRGNGMVSMLFLDLDGFKAVNDRAGHDRGDRLLIDVARDLVHALRPSDTVARLGGDEFVVLLGDDDGLEHVRFLADRIATSVRRLVPVDGTTLPLSASIGIVRADLVQEPELTAETVLRRADAAMYRAKEQGRDRHDVYDAELRQSTEARRELESTLRWALDQHRVRVLFQPVVEIDSGAVVGAEALLRVQTAEGRLLPTLPLVMAAESAGLSEVLGEQVLEAALAGLDLWPEHLHVAVNISARELTGRDFRQRVERALARAACDPQRLVLEITESSILRAGPSALAELERLRAQGVRVAVDDFGTAYATLQNLVTLPVDVLKVDASFTSGIPHDKVRSAIVSGVVSMAFALDIPCVVEGVERDEQRQALRGMSVQAQGWLWGRPGEAATVARLAAVPLQRPQSESAE